VTADDPATTLVSVRGEARVVVPPDDAVLSCHLRTVRATKPDALQEAANALAAVVEDLRSRGGHALTVASRRDELTWSAGSVTTWERHNHDHDAGERAHRPEQVVAEVDLSVVVRDMDLLDRVGGLLAEHESVHVSGVRWRVDADNPAWAEVRAAAITAATDKARDYAAALGGVLVRVEHVADAGLLGGEGVDNPADWRMQVGAADGARSATDTPALDPVPQELLATIDARFRATVPGLGDG
jgi:uncharacterized protein